jgi:hypothetical protein
MQLASLKIPMAGKIRKRINRRRIVYLYNAGLYGWCWEAVASDASNKQMLLPTRKNRMSKKYMTAILFKIDAETLMELDRAASELGHSGSLFIRDAIRRRLLDHEGSENTQTMRFAESNRLDP